MGITRSKVIFFVVFILCGHRVWFPLVSSQTRFSRAFDVTRDVLWSWMLFAFFLRYAFGTSLTHFAIFRLGWGVGVANNVQCLLSSGAMLCYWFLLLHWLSEVMLRYWPLLRHLPLRHLPQGVNAKSLKSTRRCYFIPLKEHNWIYHLITINQQGFQRLTTQPWPAGLEGRSAPNRQHGDLLPVVWTFPV